MNYVKKFLVFILISLLSFVPFSVKADTSYEYYDLEFIDNFTWYIRTGQAEFNTSWCATGRHTYYPGALYPDMSYCDYILFWNQLGIYMGYYTVNGEADNSGYHIGTYVSGSLTPPTGSKTFALTSSKDAEDSNIPTYYGPVLSTQSYLDVFDNPSYLDYADTVLNDTLGTIFLNPSYLDYTDSTLGATLSTAYESFTGGNLFKNPHISLGDIGANTPDEWTALEPFYTTLYWNDGEVNFNLEVSGDSGYYGLVETTLNASFISGHKYYIQADSTVFGGGTCRLMVYSTSVGGYVSALSMVDEVGGTFGTFYNTFTADTINDKIRAYQDDVDSVLYFLDDLYLYDLTAIFGSGFEPSSATFYNTYMSGKGTTSQTTFGDSYYTLTNLASTEVISYADLLSTYMADYAVPTYTLTRVLPTNLISNGDFSMDSNSDGLGDYWTELNATATTMSIINGVQYAQVVSVFGVFNGISQSATITSGKQYYIVLNWYNLAQNTGEVSRVYFRDDVGNIQNLYIDTALQTGQKKYLTTANANYTLFRVGNQTTSTSSYFGWDNIYVVDFTTFKASGGVAGLTDSQITAVIDDYYTNGLTASNIGYFFDGPAEWDALSITDKNAILYYYGTSYTGGTVIDVTSSIFEENFAILNYASTFEGDMLIEKVSQTYGRQDFYGMAEETIESAVEKGLTEQSLETFTSDSFIDYTKYDIRKWYDGLTIPQKIYYDALFLDALNENERWEWYAYGGVTSSNYAYYHQLYLDALATTPRYEWYTWAGVTSTNYASLLNDYTILSLMTPVSFLQFETNKVQWLYEYTPEQDLNPEINDTLDEIGISDTVRIIIGIGIIAVLCIFCAVKRASWHYYALVSFPLFFLFAILGWFAWWLTFIFVAIEMLILILVIK